MYDEERLSCLLCGAVMPKDFGPETTTTTNKKLPRFLFELLLLYLLAHTNVSGLCTFQETLVVDILSGLSLLGGFAADLCCGHSFLQPRHVQQ